MIRLRTLAILATAVMGMALLACGDDEPPAAPASVSEPPATTTVARRHSNGGCAGGHARSHRHGD